MTKMRLKGFSDEEISQSINDVASGIEFKSFSLGVSSVSPETKEESRKKAIDFVKSRFKVKHSNNDADVYFLVDIDNAFVDANPSNIFLEGRYSKHSRKIAQTFHYCFKCKGKGCRHCNNSGKLSEESVQELVEKELLAVFEAEVSKFHGCGREDVDVLMLGKGRPFVIEIISPKKRSINLKKVEEKINSNNKNKITIQGLVFTNKKKVAELKNTEFKKIYSAKCLCKEQIKEADLKKILGKELKIIQRTPIRVEKRRPDKEREKNAKITKAQLINENEFVVEILASHGLYIKEFISGDEKRTKPSISSLLEKPCLCKELDVLEILI